MCKRYKKNHIKGVKKRQTYVKMVKLHDFQVLVWTSQDFAQTQQTFAPSHDGETVTFRNSGPRQSPNEWKVNQANAAGLPCPKPLIVQSTIQTNTQYHP